MPLLKIISLCFFILILQSQAFAAYPISNAVSTKEIHQVSPQTQIPRRYVGNPHTEDMGVFGILALIFAVCGLFPLAIASGIIGTQNGRKFKGMAKAGLIVGILEATIVAGYLLFLFVLG